MDEANQVAANFIVGGEDAGYLFEFKEDGVYFTVYPRLDDGILFELTDITKILDDSAILNYRIETIAKAMREATGEAVKIAGDAEEETEPLADPKIEILISKDKMEARLHLEINENSKKLTEYMVMQKLEESGVVYGILQSAIQNAVMYSSDDVIVAKGKMPVNGVNASIKKKVEMNKQGQPEKLENDRVDYKNLGLFVVVKAGDLLAERIPHTQGIPGMNIFGEVVAAKPGKTVMLPAGKNTKIVEDHKIVAEIDGQVVVSGNKFSVSPTIVINGDVCLETGNIEFNGSVIVKGSVQAGFHIKADGDVEVAGTISGGTVEARNITVRAGIQGMQRGHIIAKEDIRSTFAENAKLIAGRDAIITEAILHSKVSAGKKIIVQGRRGIIAGGTAAAGEEIVVKCAGNQMDVSTKLEVGINPMLKEEYKEAQKALHEAEEALEQTQKALSVLKAVRPDLLTETKRERLLHLTKSQFPLAGTVKKYKDRIREIEEAFENLKEGKIKVTDYAYPGVKLVIGSVIKHIRSKTQHCTFYAEGGEIKTGPY